MKAGVLVVALVLAFAGLGHGAKHKFKEGDKVTLWANKGACPWSRHGVSRAPGLGTASPAGGAGCGLGTFVCAA